MDKNTIIGFILIGIVLFGFSWWNRPTPEQIEAQRRYQDSIAQIELAKQAELEKQNADPVAGMTELPRCMWWIFWLPLPGLPKKPTAGSGRGSILTSITCS